MTARPTSNPLWATDATVLSGPEVGLAPRVIPSDGVRQQGFQADQGVAARAMNGQLGAVGDWITYLDSKATRSIVVATGPFIHDNTVSGPGPQIVDNTPRAVRDSDGNALIMSCSANAGERMIIRVGPLFVQPIYIPSTTPTVYVRALVQHIPGFAKTFTQRFDAQSNPSLGKTPIDWTFYATAPSDGTYTVSLFAWALKLNDSVTILSPGCYTADDHATWPEEDTGLQQWGSIAVTAA